MLNICGHLGQGWEVREGSLNVWATGKRRVGPDVTRDKTEGQGGERGQDGSKQTELRRVWCNWSKSFARVDPFSLSMLLPKMKQNSNKPVLYIDPL